MSLRDRGGQELTDIDLSEGFGLLEMEAEPGTAGLSPSRLALRRLKRNRTAQAFGLLLLIIVLLCLLAPVYAHDIAHTGPNTENIGQTVTINGKQVPVTNSIGIPIGPTWTSHFFLGADSLGRDLAVRLLYGGRASLFIGLVATVITMFFAVILGVLAGYFRGWTDGIISRVFDIIWAYPALLLAIALGTSLALGGITIGPLHVSGNALWLPAAIIGVVYIPYVARPIRGEVLSLRQREFVDAARVLGAGNLRIMVSEILPNLTSIFTVFVGLQLAQSIILEAALSFLGAGVQPPNASWGTLLSSGYPEFNVAPHLTLAPAIMLILTCLSVNVVSDGVRQAFDPKARVKVVR